MDKEIGYIPKSLDAQEKWVIWETDQLIIALMLLGIGIALSQMLGGIVVGAVAAWAYGRMKSGKHPKFAIHSLYWWLPAGWFSVVKPKVTPTSDQRYFLG